MDPLNDFCYPLYINGCGVGNVVILPQKKEVTISSYPDYGAKYRLTLGEFSEINSKIPWTKMQDRIKGFKITLYYVYIDDDYDIKCKEWFENIGCTVSCFKSIYS